MTIAADIQSLSQKAVVELFILDTTKYAGGTVMRFHAGTNSLVQPVVWQGAIYEALPIEAEGFDVSTQGTLPRPKMRVANVDGLFSAEVRQFNDLIGCKITRKRTFVQYLDAVNFSGGNPTADSNQHFDDDIWFVEQKTTENKHVIEWELATAMDLQGVMLPYRQIIQNTCPWQYKGPECGYAGTAYFNGGDAPCSLSEDDCGKRLKSCELRFGTANKKPFGGFPGALKYAY